jgi:hypothetical protein
MKAEPSATIRRFKKVIHIAIGCKVLQGLVHGEKVFQQAESFVQTMTCDKDLGEFNLEHQRLDVFLAEKMGKDKKYANLWYLCQRLLILSHGQARVK